MDSKSTLDCFGGRGSTRKEGKFVEFGPVNDQA
jgi:hypothetical protein